MDGRDIAETQPASDIESRIDALGEAIAALRRTLPSVDVATRLSAQVDAMPDTIAARLGIEASNAAIGLRIGGLASAIEQAKLAGQAGAEQTRAAIEEPDWLHRLLVRLDAIDRSIHAVDEADAAHRQAVEEQLDELAERLEAIETASRTRDAEAPPRALYERLGVLAEQIRTVADVDERTKAILERVDVPSDGGRLVQELQSLADAVAQVLQASALERDRHQSAVDVLRTEIAALGEVPDRLTEIGVAIEDIAAAPDDAHAIAEVSNRLLEVMEHLPTDATPVSMAAVFDRMEQRDRSIAARLDRLLEAVARGLPTTSGGATRALPRVDVDGDTVSPALDGLAAATDDLAALVAATAERVDAGFTHVRAAVAALDERLDNVERATLAAVTGGPDSAATLALLRAERAMVQARLEEERRIAAEELPDAPG
jgi:hypothetical protein